MKAMIKKLTHNLQVSILIIAVTIFNFIFPSGGLFGATMPAYERLEPITDYLDSPTSIALDAYENLYVAESTSNRLIIFSQSGSFLNVLSGLKRPISIDVDRVGKIYIGND